MMKTVTQRQASRAGGWLAHSTRREQVLLTLKQPMTAKQLSRLTEMRMDFCSEILWQLREHGLVYCTNWHATRSRLYWLTRLGKACQDALRRKRGLPPLRIMFPRVDWTLYGWACFSHRAAIIRALTEPLQPATIKRRALKQNERLRMSANNVRDVIRLYVKRGVVEPIHVRKKTHPLYELTETGKKMRDLLVAARIRA